MRAFGTVTQYKTEPVNQASYVIKLVEDTSPQMIIKKPQAQMNKIIGNPQPQYPHIIEKKPFYHQQKIHVLSRQPLTFRRPAKPEPIIPIIPPVYMEPIMSQNSDPNPPMTHLLQSSFVSQYKPNQIQQPKSQPLREQVLLDQDNQMNINEGAQRYSRVYRPNAIIIPPPIIHEQQLSERTQHITLGTTQPLNIPPSISHSFSPPFPYEQLSERTEHITLGATEPLVIPPPKLDQQLSQRTQHMKLSATQPLLLPRQQIIQQPRQNIPVMSQIVPNDKDDNSSVSSKKSYVNFSPIQPIYLKSIKKDIKNNTKSNAIPTPPIAVKKQENPPKQKDSQSQVSVVEFNPLNPIMIEPTDSISVVEFDPIKPILINAQR